MLRLSLSLSQFAAPLGVCACHLYVPCTNLGRVVSTSHRKGEPVSISGQKLLPSTVPTTEPGVVTSGYPVNLMYSQDLLTLFNLGIAFVQHYALPYILSYTSQDTMGVRPTVISSRLCTLISASRY